ncbi:hypothetical protein CRG98_014671 [Punica granatum]|uniref:Uncharacterized protein n=1 Tax=Punica granatum TaxID=22663 RepID=A0A2I0K8R3_PUNGR|nr:hypothetical protein CRG98_014671 [Punica granatum]
MQRGLGVSTFPGTRDGQNFVGELGRWVDGPNWAEWAGLGRMDIWASGLGWAGPNANGLPLLDWAELSRAGPTEPLDTG